MSRSVWPNGLRRTFFVLVGVEGPESSKLLYYHCIVVEKFMNDLDVELQLEIDVRQSELERVRSLDDGKLFLPNLFD